VVRLARGAQSNPGRRSAYQFATETIMLVTPEVEGHRIDAITTEHDRGIPDPAVLRSHHVSAARRFETAPRGPAAGMSWFARGHPIASTLDTNGCDRCKGRRFRWLILISVRQGVFPPLAEASYPR
jgi:hypothetical protein